ncbi:YlmH family RNA-binding protein [Anaerocolumna sp. MB42-C2]|uniref:YlmH family RNA-binding protein n=1 Tax=Anaerocolumna sp. MB42-C2 TaxID=3070997 RepID=UPI0027E1E072|nr:YlmH/Sll1252 family protein [Anaerocolumna sp. MB42-C2]WMJ88244.1 YlmH/Sll1252 family protein [Anaerocolumna sp. MB42-C2]
MNSDKEEQILRKRILDLARAADNKDICTYTDFLNLNEASIFFSMKKDIPNVNYDLFGGYNGAERKVLCFYGDNSVKAFSDYITCIRILPLNKKFSDDLNHRDFLGSLMNLGIDRSKIGDILVKEKEGYVFCESSISRFILDNLDKVKHTNIKCSVMENESPDIQPNFQEIRGSVSSARLDAVIALAFNSSRNSILGLISGGKVFVDGKLIESNSYMLKEEETVSVRGMGKFIYKGKQNQSKKGRYFVALLKYI